VTAVNDISVRINAPTTVDARAMLRTESAPPPSLDARVLVGRPSRHR
jgi:hypothetical protein